MSEPIDNGSPRVRTLKKRVIRGLRNGEPLEVVKAGLVSLARECGPSEIASMEEELLESGIPIAQVLGTCDLPSQAVREVVVEPDSAEIAPGHPLELFHRENVALREQVERLRAALAALAAGEDGSGTDASLVQARHHYGLLTQVEKHYLRKEHVLFPFLERRGITGPTAVMWGKDDEVRALLVDLGEALAAVDASAGEWRLVVQAVAEPAFTALEEMIIKEERILFPMSLQALDEADWGDVAARSPRFGYCIVARRS